MHIDRWHGDHLPAETAFGRSVDRVLVSKPFEYLVFWPLGITMSFVQFYYPIKMLIGLFH